jgi:hypothetical protein
MTFGLNAAWILRWMKIPDMDMQNHSFASA